MKKNLFSLLSIFLVATLCAGFASCGDSDDGDSKSDIVQNLMNHKWMGSATDYDVYSNSLAIDKQTYIIFFTSENKGVIWTKRVVDDSSLGKDRSEDAIAFTYTISGNTIRLSGGSNLVLEYCGDHLQQGDFSYKQLQLTSDDREWLKEVQYSLMPDDERCKINFTHGWKDVRTFSSTKSSTVTVYLTIPASEKVHSRCITSFTATYTMPGKWISLGSNGYWYREKQKNTIITSEDKDYSKAIVLSIEDELPVSISVEFSVHDNKNHEDVVIGHETYTITADGNQNNGGTDNGGTDNGGTNNGGTNNGGTNNGGTNNPIVNTSLCPDSHHPHMIDLGLPSGTKWACCNVGASKPENYGDYYAWGETSTKNKYNWETYKYGSSANDIEYIGSDIAGTIYDAATKWGALCKMPTKAQINELISETTYEKVKYNNVDGGKFTSRANGNYIFLPFNNNGMSGDYWSSTLDEGEWAVELYIDEPTSPILAFNRTWKSAIRYRGLGVRAVK